jgi:hypothetical protein
LVLVRLATVPSAQVSRLDFSWLTTVHWCASFSCLCFLVRESKIKRAIVFLSCMILLSLLQDNSWVPEAKKKKKRGLLFLSLVGRTWRLLFIALYFHSKNSRVLKKTYLHCFFLYAFAVARHCCSCALVVVMGSSSTSSGPVSVLRCPVLFNGTIVTGFLVAMSDAFQWYHRD